ncbi:hypothetical protein BH11BAC7_BH11BAC7_28660 [soil metagenome]
MRKATPAFKGILLAAALLSAPVVLNAQYFWETGINTGVSNYLGDLGGNELTRRDFVADIKLQKTNINLGGFVRYKVNRYFSAQANISWLRISGDDKLSANPARNARNLSFRNDLIEAAVQGQFYFYEVNDLGHTYRHKDAFRAYVGIGAGAVYHNPKTSYNDEWLALRPLTTEGKKYSKVTAVVPVSGGFYFVLNKNYHIGWNLTWRTAFSDYLDDVSTTYADNSELPSSLAIELANRTDELVVNPAFAENFTPGNKRGDSKHNDSYLSTSIDMSYAFKGRSAFDKAQHPWVGHRQNHPDKYNGPGNSRRGPFGIVRKVRLHW